MIDIKFIKKNYKRKYPKGIIGSRKFDSETIILTIKNLFDILKTNYRLNLTYGIVLNLLQHKIGIQGVTIESLQYSNLCCSLFDELIIKKYLKDFSDINTTYFKLSYKGLWLSYLIREEKIKTTDYVLF